MKTSILFTLLLINVNLIGQNLVVNGDFENFIDCPTGIGQANKATNWLQSVISSDYYNCNFVSQSELPSTSSAFSGTGFAGFLSYGDDNGSAEGIGQILSEKLIPNNSYSVRIATKIPNDGDYTTDCGGLELYGFPGDPPIDADFIHTSQYNGAMLLGNSSSIQNTDWQFQIFELNIPDTVNSIVFTISSAPNCLQYIFIDSVYITTENLLPISSIENSNEFLKLYPNPTYNEITIELTPQVDLREFTISIIDFSGKLIHQNIIDQNIINMNISHLPQGIYYCKIQNERDIFTKKFIVTKK